MIASMLAARVFAQGGQSSPLPSPSPYNSQSNSQSTASIAGSVIDSVTRQALPGVSVRARSFGGGQGNARFASATSDTEGHFILDALAPGRYMINASQQGYLNQRISGGSTNGRFLVVAPDQHTEDLVIELIPAANITGHIKNADGKLLSNVSIEVVHYSYSGGQKELRGATSPHFSNADGEYRITDVAPGKYYIRAIAPEASSSDASTDDPPARQPTASQPAPSAAVTAKPTTTLKDKEQDTNKNNKDKPKPEVYATTYYPNGTDAANASPLVVRAGQDLAGIDITLTPVHTVAVDGKVILSSSHDTVAGADVTLVNADGSSSERHASADAKGAFVLKNVAPGEYVLIARVEPANAKSKMLFGFKSIRVEEKNLAGIDLPIGDGVQVSGHIHLDDKTNADLGKITAALEPEGLSSVTALSPEVTSVQVRPDGSFTFADVPEGAYALDLSPLPPGTYLKSAGAVDVMESGVQVAQGQSPAPLDLTISSSAAQLTGVVLNEQMPAPDTRVVLLPTGNRRGQPRFFKRAITDQSGRFTMKGVIPGEYRVLAIESLDRSLMSDPDFLEQFEDRGETVRLQEGGTQDVRLAAIPTADATP